MSKATTAGRSTANGMRRQRDRRPHQIRSSRVQVQPVWPLVLAPRPTYPQIPPAELPLSHGWSGLQGSAGRAMSEPTSRQIAVLLAWVECGTSEDAGVRLGMHPVAVRKVLAELIAVYGVKTSAQVFGCAIRDGLIDVSAIELQHCA